MLSTIINNDAIAQISLFSVHIENFTDQLYRNRLHEVGSGKTIFRYVETIYVSRLRGPE